MDYDLAIVGAGIAGASLGWHLRDSGLRIAMVDPSPGQGATSVAAGMLAPGSEAEFGEPDMARLLQEAAAYYHTFAPELASDPEGMLGYE
ncbi:MAG: FAD-dependent oxidoreductase, partial [Acidimicrobiales bacterium]